MFQTLGIQNSEQENVLPTWHLYFQETGSIHKDQIVINAKKRIKLAYGCGQQFRNRSRKVCQGIGDWIDT